MTIRNGNSADGSEFELKFRVSPTAARGLRQHVPIPHARKIGEMPERLRSIYFDTPNLQLRRRGVELRVRHVNGRIIQTVKAISSEGGPFERFECEHEITGEQPDLSRIDAAGLQKMFARINA